MADLVNAVVLGTLTGRGPGGIVFPLVLIPVYGVPRGFLIHSFTDRPAAQNVATATACGVAALRDGHRSRMSVTRLQGRC